MAKSIRDIPKKKRRGRPKTTGRGEGILVRLHDDALKSLDAWSHAQEDEPSRPEAIRRLVELGLASVRSASPVNQKAANKASKLAGKMVDFLSDQSATTEEKAKRKRRLLKGPPEFRDMRTDLAKKS
jgi:hypothetical protein